MRASAAICAGSSTDPEIGKFSTARWVCAPYRAYLGTRTSPIVSCSMRYSASAWVSTTVCLSFLLAEVVSVAQADDDVGHDPALREPAVGADDRESVLGDRGRDDLGLREQLRHGVAQVFAPDLRGIDRRGVDGARPGDAVHGGEDRRDEV